MIQLIHELRAYDLIPGKAPAYIAMFRRAGVQFVTRHLPMAGYWLTDSGALNRLYHLWIYESLEERAACRAGLAGDPEWNSQFVPGGFPLIVSQQNFLMAVERSSPALDAAVAGRKTLRKEQEESVPMFSNALLSLTFGTNSPTAPDAEHLASWRVRSGAQVGQTVSLHRHAGSDPMETAQSVERHEILRPLSLSPLR